MANTKVVVADSAMPYKTKKLCLVQEVVRILRNTSTRLDSSVKTHHLSEFSGRLRESGYGQRIRMEIMKRGIEIYERQVERDKNGTCPLYRPKGYDKDTRRKKKRRSKASWYKPFDTVMFCPPTPNEELARTLREIVQDQKAEGLNIKVVERAGVKISSLLPGLKEKENCEREDCFIHTTGGRGNCNKENVVYKGECLECEDMGKKSVYIGESSRSAYVRGKQHLEAIKEHNKHQSNAYAKHIKDRHEGRKTKFRMNIITYHNTPLERQVREGVEIVRADADVVLNSRLDYFQPGIRRVTFGDVYDDLES